MIKNIFLIPLICFAACTKSADAPKTNPFEQIGCDIAKTVGNQFSFNLATYLECEDKTCFNQNVINALIGVGVCKQATAMGLKSIGSTICESAGQIVLNLAVAQVPASCQCKLTVAKDKVAEIATKLCGKL